jgi:hypothetical protein
MAVHAGASARLQSGVGEATVARFSEGYWQQVQSNYAVQPSMHTYRLTADDSSTRIQGLFASVFSGPHANGASIIGNLGAVPVAANIGQARGELALDLGATGTGGPAGLLSVTLPSPPINHPGLLNGVGMDTGRLETARQQTRMGMPQLAFFSSEEVNNAPAPESPTSAAISRVLYTGHERDDHFASSIGLRQPYQSDVNQQPGCHAQSLPRDATRPPQQQQQMLQRHVQWAQQSFAADLEAGRQQFFGEDYFYVGLDERGRAVWDGAAGAREAGGDGAGRGRRRAIPRGTHAHTDMPRGVATAAQGRRRRRDDAFAEDDEAAYRMRTVQRGGHADDADTVEEENAVDGYNDGGRYRQAVPASRGARTWQRRRGYSEDYGAGADLTGESDDGEGSAAAAIPAQGQYTVATNRAPTKIETSLIRANVCAPTSIRRIQLLKEVSAAQANSADTSAIRSRVAWIGVSFVPRLRKFRSYYFHPDIKKTIGCGSYLTAYDAAKARQIAILELGPLIRTRISQDFIPDAADAEAVAVMSGNPDEIRKYRPPVSLAHAAVATGRGASITGKQRFGKSTVSTRGSTPDVAGSMGFGMGMGDCEMSGMDERNLFPSAYASSHAQMDAWAEQSTSAAAGGPQDGNETREQRSATAADGNWLNLIGVAFAPELHMYRSFYSHPKNRQDIHCGTYETAYDAAKARQIAILLLEPRIASHIPQDFVPDPSDPDAASMYSNNMEQIRVLADRVISDAADLAVFTDGLADYGAAEDSAAGDDGGHEGIKEKPDSTAGDPGRSRFGRRVGSWKDRTDDVSKASVPGRPRPGKYSDADNNPAISQELEQRQDHAGQRMHGNVLVADVPAADGPLSSMTAPASADQMQALMRVLGVGIMSAPAAMAPEGNAQYMHRINPIRPADAAPQS